MTENTEASIVCIYSMMLFLSPCMIIGCRGRMVSLLYSHGKYDSKTRYDLCLCENGGGDQQQTAHNIQTNKSRMETGRIKAIVEGHRKNKRPN